jgi:hypothetical protein
VHIRPTAKTPRGLTYNRETLKVKTLSVKTYAYEELSYEHAIWEGFSTLDELKRNLATYYSDIGDDDPVGMFANTARITLFC